jgi:hypothetical protein
VAMATKQALEVPEGRNIYSMVEGLELQSSFRSVIAVLPPINGLEISMGGASFYKYFVPPGLIKPS